MGASSRAAPITVLSVTADPAHARRVERDLQTEPHIRVETRTTVAEGFGRLAADPPVDCVLSEVALPDFDGVTFLQAVRPGCPDIPFILFLPEDAGTDQRRAISARVTDFVDAALLDSGTGELGRLVDRAVSYRRARTALGFLPPLAASILDTSLDLMAVVVDGRIEYLNAVGLAYLGVGEAESIEGQPLTQIITNGAWDPVRSAIDALGRDGVSIRAVESELVGYDGARHRSRLTLTAIDWAGSRGTLLIARPDERFGVGTRLRELRRINAVIREINRVIVRSTDRGTLERTVCERFVESDPYTFAWIAEADPETGIVSPRATAGNEVDYLEDIEITTDESPTGMGPTGRAFRTGEPQCMQNILLDERFTPWRETALEYGYRSSAALPIAFGDTIFGVLNLYADRPFAFDEREISVLEELADDIGFSIAAIQTRAELERSEQALTAIEDRLSVALEASGAGVWEWDLATDTVVWHESCERLFGLEPGSFGGTYEDFIAQVHPQDLDDLQADLAETLEYGQQLQSEFRIVRPDGRKRWIRAFGELLESEDADGLTLVGVDVDITETKERALHLKVFDRVLRHNLNNDMNVIGGFAEMIADREEGPSQDDARRIVHHSEKLVATADKEREIVEILSERPRQVRRDLSDLIEDTIERFERRFPRATFEYDGPDSSAVTVTDRFYRALEELLENAVIHAGVAAPTVVVELECLPETYRLHIIDECPEIPAMNVTVLTEDHDIDPLYHGSGLGLWLVNWIVDRSSGTISFRWQESRGNQIIITLPRDSGGFPRDG